MPCLSSIALPRNVCKHMADTHQMHDIVTHPFHCAHARSISSFFPFLHHESLVNSTSSAFCSVTNTHKTFSLVSGFSDRLKHVTGAICTHDSATTWWVNAKVSCRACSLQERCSYHGNVLKLLDAISYLLSFPFDFSQGCILHFRRAVLVCG